MVGGPTSMITGPASPRATPPGKNSYTEAVCAAIQRSSGFPSGWWGQGHLGRWLDPLDLFPWNETSEAQT